MPRSSNISQHYVPKFYLKNFVNEKGRLHVLNVKDNSTYTKSPKKEGREDFFYDLNIDLSKKFFSETTPSEEFLDDKIRLLNEQVSSLLLNYLKNVRHASSDFEFPRESRNQLYRFIVLQSIRTPDYRKGLEYFLLPVVSRADIDTDKYSEQELLDFIHNLILVGVVEKLYSEDFELNELYHNTFDHIILELVDFVRQLENAGKLFLVNKTDESFLTSNSPINVLWKRNLLAQLRSLIWTPDPSFVVKDAGQPLEFMTIHFPIAPDVSIFIFHKGYDSNLTNLNQGIGVIESYNSSLGHNLNYGVFLRSSSKVFSPTGQFQHFIEKKKNRINPELIFWFDQGKKPFEEE